MPLLLRYHRETGAIVETWESNSLAVIEAQRVDDDPGHGYLLCTEALAASTVEQGYLVRDGALVAQTSTREEN